MGTGNLYNVEYVSSQAISGGAIIGDIHSPSDYVIYQVSSQGGGITYYGKNCRNGVNDYSDTDASTLFNSIVSSNSNLNVFITSGNYYISSTIYPHPYTTLHGGMSSKLNLQQNVDGIVIKGYTGGTKYVTLSDLFIDLPAIYDSSVIKLYSHQHVCDFNRIQNITIRNLIDSPSYHSGTAIHFYASGDTYSPSIWGNVVENITTDGGTTAGTHDSGSIGTGVLFEVYGADPWINGNTVKSMLINGGKIAVNLNTYNNGGINNNYFEDVKMQALWYTTDGFRIISGNQNSFMDCHLWDTSIADNFAYYYYISGGEYNKIVTSIGPAVANYYDGGVYTITQFGGNIESQLARNARIQNNLKVDGEISGNSIITDNMSIQTSVAGDAPLIVKTFGAGGIFEEFYNTNRTWRVGEDNDGFFRIRDESAETYPITIEDGVATSTLLLKNDKVGIGKNPTYTLDIEGTVGATSVSSQAISGGTSQFYTTQLNPHQTTPTATAGTLWASSNTAGTFCPLYYCSSNESGAEWKLVTFA